MAVLNGRSLSAYYRNKIAAHKGKTRSSIYL